METDKYVTLVSETNNNNNFTIHFIDYLTLGVDWEVAMVQAYIPHRDSHFQDSFKSYFPNNKVIGGLAVHYNTSPTDTSSASKTTTVRIDDIIDGIGRGTSKLDVLKMIYSAACNKIMYELRTDASVTASYPKDNNGNMLHQTLEETTYGVTLKGYAVTGGRCTLDKTLTQMMGVMNAAWTALGNGVHYRIIDNDNIKRTSTFTWNNSEINLYLSVDWVFTTLQTPWPKRYIPEKVYKHVDINCDMIVSNKVNDDDKYILHHAEIPGDGALVVPQQRSYMKLDSVSYAYVSVWLTDVAGRLPTLQSEKTRLVLHFRKKPLQNM